MDGGEEVDEGARLTATDDAIKPTRRTEASDNQAAVHSSAEEQAVMRLLGGRPGLVSVSR